MPVLGETEAQVIVSKNVMNFEDETDEDEDEKV